MTDMRIPAEMSPSVFFSFFLCGTSLLCWDSMGHNERRPSLSRLVNLSEERVISARPQDLLLTIFLRGSSGQTLSPSFSLSSTSLSTVVFYLPTCSMTHFPSLIKRDLYYRKWCSVKCNNLGSCVIFTAYPVSFVPQLWLSLIFSPCFHLFYWKKKKRVCVCMSQKKVNDTFFIMDIFLKVKS